MGEFCFSFTEKVPDILQGEEIEKSESAELSVPQHCPESREGKLKCHGIISQQSTDVWDIGWDRSIALLLPKALAGIHH